MQQEIKDGLIFHDEDNPHEKIIFNFYTWVKIVEASIVKYAHKTPQEAQQLVAASGVCQHPVDSALGAAMISHEYEYNWAMFLAYGNNYWERGIPSDLPENYYGWVKQYCLEQGLAPSSFIFYNDELDHEDWTIPDLN